MSAIEQIKKDEGHRGRPYKCTAGATTIGFGRNLDANPLTEKESEYLLRNDLESVYLEAKTLSFYSGLNSVRQDVIINMIYNLGLSRFLKFKNFIKALREGYYVLASIEMLDSLWARQVGSRATNLAKQMKEGVN